MIHCFSVQRRKYQVAHYVFVSKLPIRCAVSYTDFFFLNKMVICKYNNLHRLIIVLFLFQKSINCFWIFYGSKLGCRREKKVENHWSTLQSNSTTNDNNTL